MTYHCESYFRFRVLHDIDKDDDKFVDCAIAADADFIVTEDGHFNVLTNLGFPPVRVVTLDEFMGKRI